MHHVLLASIVSDEKSAIICVIVSLYVTYRFYFLLAPFSSDFSSVSWV